MRKAPPATPIPTPAFAPEVSRLPDAALFVSATPASAMLDGDVEELVERVEVIEVTNEGSDGDTDDVLEAVDAAFVADVVDSRVVDAVLPFVVADDCAESGCVAVP